jgi:hypothetical protein
MADAAKSAKVNDGKNGLPTFKDDEQATGASGGAKLTVAMSLIQPAIGFALANVFYGMSGDSTAKKIALVKEYDFQWIFLAAVIINRLVAVLNMYPVRYLA